MPQQLTEDELFELAKARVEEKKGFYSHLASYCIVNLGLFLLWRFATGAGYPWFIWPLAGWGIGLAFHFINVFVVPAQHGGWEQREIRKEMERLRDQMKKQ